MAAQRETAVIEGKAYWSKLNKKDEYSDKYQMDIGNLSEETKELLKENGVKVKNKEMIEETLSQLVLSFLFQLWIQIRKLLMLKHLLVMVVV